MKVLEKKDWSGWRHRCQCPKCESKLEAEPQDIICHPASGGNQHDYCPEYFTINCAVCSQSISVDEKLIPNFLRDQARTRANNRSYGAYDR